MIEEQMGIVIRATHKFNGYSSTPQIPSHENMTG
jgi:hypothetical protein